MHAPSDIPRNLADAMPPETGDPDARRARMGRTGRARRWFRLPGWLTEVRRVPEDGSSLPVLRDYPWRSSGGA